jgi:hydroxyethylthiazole kinase-like uncharacterized protein yjeF
MDLPEPLAPLPCASEMSSYDQACISSGTPALELMERAARAVFLELQRSLALLQGQQRKFLILAGPGNNGGDGVALARMLQEDGQDPALLLAGAGRYSAELLRQLERYQGPLFVQGSSEAVPAGARVRSAGLEHYLVESQYIVDALLGTGQKGVPRGTIAEVLVLAQSKAAPSSQWISIDVPTGVDADSGQVFEPHVSADLLLAIQYCKRGLLQYPARLNFKQLRCLDIGIAESSKCEFQALSKQALPQRSAQAHKGSFGRVLVLGGCARYPGAPLLAARAALRSGAGLVTRAVPEGLSQTQPSAEEIIQCPLPGKTFSTKHAAALIAEMRASNVLLLGPGLGRSTAAQSLAQLLLQKASALGLPMVVDADGLVALAALTKKVRATRKKSKATATVSTLVITPHPGEAALLLGISSAQVQADRYAAVRALAQKYKATVVLKGAGTIVYAAAASGGWVYDYANPYLATAGSGDVLAGVLASLLGQGLAVQDAACTAVRLHGMAADSASHGRSRPIIASDLIDALPQAIATLGTAHG